MKTVAVKEGPGVTGVASTSGVPVGRRVRRSRRRRMLGAWLGIAAALLLPALAAAHPLGNFTINHYTGIRVEADRILLDVVIDQAEIPAFAARLDFDTDGDGEVSDAETDVGRGTACQKLAPTLTLAVDGKPQVLTLTVAGLRFPPGVGGLSTMRLICGYQATLAAPLAAGSLVTYADTSFTDRLGWREIVVSGSGVTLTGKDGAELRTTTTSARLTLYPTNLLTQALQDKSVAIVATPGGPTLPALDIPDAAPLTGAVVAGASASPAMSGAGAGAGPVATAAPVIAPAVAGTVPGGVTSGDLPDIFRSADLSPVVFIVSILTAAVLGAGHALTPGHGKTLMAAYLVGTKGTPLHAAGLGLSVTLSHTIGILVLAGLVVGAQGFLPPDLVVKILPIIAAFSIVAIGGWMVFSEGRRRWLVRAAAHEHGETLSHAVPAAHEHGVAEGHQADHGHAHEAAGAHVHPYEPGVAAAHEHPHPHESAVAAAHAHPHPHPHVPAPGEHNHGGVTHTHLPPAGAAITWRSLFVLGLAGGLIPSASALLILLGSIAAGRPAFGFVLVVAFGLGMAFVMSGIGLALVLARGRLDKVDSASSLGRASRYLPLVASFLVFGLGLYLTFQAVAGNTTF